MKCFIGRKTPSPQRTDVSMFLKFYGEIAEMIESGGDTDEIADVFILLLDYARRKNIDVATQFGES